MEEKRIRVLFLDDMDERHRTFMANVGEAAPEASVHQARTAFEAIAALDREEFSQAFLDHDLSLDDVMSEPGKPTTVPSGMAVVDYLLTSSRPWPREIVIHSCNPPAAEAMRSALQQDPRERGVMIHVVPFPTLIAILKRTETQRELAKGER